MTSSERQYTADEFLDMSVTDRQAYLDSGGVPPHLTDSQIQELPPTQVGGYFDNREAAGIDEGGITGFIERTMAHVRAGADANRAQDERMRAYTSGDREYVEGLEPSNHDYQGEQHAAMSTYVADIDAAQVAEVSDAYHELHRAFQDFAEELKSAVDSSQNEWEGEAADKAHGYFTSLRDWSDANSQNAQLASQTVYQQSEAASTAKNSMPEEVPFSWESEMKKWGSSPLSVIDNISNSIETYQASQEAHSQAAQVMTQYDTALYEAASKQPVFAEPPKFGDSGTGTGTGVTPPGSINMPGGNGGTDASGYTGGGVPGGGGGVPGGSSVPSGSGSYPGGSGPGGGTYTPAPLPGGSTTGSGSLPGPGNTRPSGYQPPRTPIPRGSGRNNNPNFGGMGGPVPVGGMGGAGGFGGGSDYSSKLGRGAGAGGFGPGGSAGSGASSGAASGARPGMPGAAGGAVPGGAGAAAAAGRGGMAGGMGAGAGRGGKGGEDDEHQRPTYLVEGDPDEVFGTDQRTAPPVIGE